MLQQATTEINNGIFTPGFDQQLLRPHYAMLHEGSGLSDDIIRERGYSSVLGGADLRERGFNPAQCRLAPGLLVPIHPPDGSNGVYQYRPNKPRVIGGRETKYESQAGAEQRLDVPPRCRPMLADQTIPLYVTEGAKKADSLAANDRCVVGLAGVWNSGGTTALDLDWEAIALKGRLVLVVFDSDIMTKRSVAKALDRITERLTRKGANVCPVYLPSGESGEKVGVDDFLLTHSIADLDALVGQARPSNVIALRPKAQAPGIAAADPTDTRPLIDAGEMDLPVVTGAAWDAVVKANEPPRLFRQGLRPIRLVLDSFVGPSIEDLTPERLRGEAGRAAQWFTAKSVMFGGGIEKLTVEAMPPPSVIADMLALPELPLPQLIRVVEAPVFAPDGTLQTDAGYHLASRCYFAPAKGFSVPTVPTVPTESDVTTAKVLLLDDLLGDFPFIADADRAHAIALFILPFVRDLIAGPTPLHMLEAPTPGSGKSLLADVLMLPFLGQCPPTIAEAKDDNELRKRLTAVFAEARSTVLIDNVVRPLESGTLSSALTSTIWTDRWLGANKTVIFPVRCVWMATANNPTMSGEIARRTIRIRVDPKQDRPFLREGFKHPDLRTWTTDHRSELVAAALTLVRHWQAIGSPAFAGRKLGSYEHWSAVIGGILQAVSIPGFLDSVIEFYEQADNQGAVWRELLSAWWDRHGGHAVRVTELFDLAQGIDGLDLGEGALHSQRIRFGLLLNRQRDRVIGAFRVNKVGETSGTSLWKLQKATPPTKQGDEQGVLGVLGVLETPSPNGEGQNLQRIANTPNTPNTPFRLTITCSAPDCDATEPDESAEILIQSEELEETII